MTDKLKKALDIDLLDNCIKHWQVDIRDNLEPVVTGECALCIEYLINACRGCPIDNRTGDGCTTSPIGDLVTEVEPYMANRDSALPRIEPEVGSLEELASDLLDQAYRAQAQVAIDWLTALQEEIRSQ